MGKGEGDGEIEITSGRVERGEARGKGRAWETDIFKMNSTTSRTVCITTNCGKFFEMGIPDHLTCLLRNLYAGQEATVKTEHGTMDWFQIGKGIMSWLYIAAYLTYMQSTSRKVLGWMKHKLESRLQEEISITSDMQMTPTLWQKVKRD